MISTLALLEELDLVALFQGDDRLLPILGLGGAASHATHAAADDAGVDVGDGDLEEGLHRVADLDLVRAARDLEENLVVVLAQTTGLLREDDRPLDDLLGRHDRPSFTGGGSAAREPSLRLEKGPGGRGGGCRTR